MRLRSMLAAALLAVAAACGASAQVPAASAIPASSGSFAAGPAYTSADGFNQPAWPSVDVVLRNVQVKDAAGVHLLENGRDRGAATAVRRFEAAGYGIEAVMAIDASGSMKGRPLEMLRGSLARFVSEARDQDKVAIVTFADDTRWDVPFDAPRAKLGTALSHVEGRGRLTRLYDAIFECLGRFDMELQRRELIVISDGHDEGSRRTPDEVIAEAKRLNIAVDAIGVTRSDPRYLKNLQALAQGTTGSFRAARSDAELNAMVGNGIGTLKAQPLATFSLSGDARDGREHTLEVKLTDSGQTSAVVITAPPTGTGSETKSKSEGLLASFKARGTLVWIAGIGGALLAAIVLVVVLIARRPGTQTAETPPQFWNPPQPPTPPQPQFQPRPRAAQRSRSPTVPERSALAPMPAPGPAAWPGAMPAAIPFVAPTVAEPAWGAPAAPPPFQPAPAAGGPAQAAAPRVPSPSVRPARAHTQMVQFFDAKPGEPFARLLATGGPLQGQAAGVSQPVLRVGAAPDNDLPLPADDSLSGHHACLRLESGIWILEDLNSTNGTFVNGERIRGVRRTLSPGDEIRMGRSVFRVERCS